MSASDGGARTKPAQSGLLTPITPPGLSTRKHFAHRTNRIGQVLHQRVAEDAVKARVLKRQRVAIGLLEVGIADAALRRGFDRTLNLRLTEVDTNDSSASDSVCNAERDRTRPAAAVEHRNAGCQIRQKELAVRFDRAPSHELGRVRRMAGSVGRGYRMFGSCRDERLHLERFAAERSDSHALDFREDMSRGSFPDGFRRHQPQARCQRLQARERRRRHGRCVRVRKLHDRRDEASGLQQATDRRQHGVGIDVLKQQRGKHEIDRSDVHFIPLQIGDDQLQSGQSPLESLASGRDVSRIDVDADDSRRHLRINAVETVAAGTSQDRDRRRSVLA